MAAVEPILRLLRGPRDEERFVGLLMVTKHISSASAAAPPRATRAATATADGASSAAAAADGTSPAPATTATTTAAGMEQPPHCGLASCAAAATNQCSGCKAKWYCSQEHQRSDWKAHKVECYHSGQASSEDADADIGAGAGAGADANAGPVPASPAEQHRRLFFDAIGVEFLARLFHTSSSPSSGKGADAQAGKEALAGQYMPLAASIISYFCVDPFIAVQFRDLLPFLLPSCLGAPGQQHTAEDLLRCSCSIAAALRGVEHGAAALAPFLTSTNFAALFAILQREASATGGSGGEEKGGEAGDEDRGRPRRMEGMCLAHIQTFMALRPELGHAVLTAPYLEAVATLLVLVGDDYVELKFAALHALVACASALESESSSQEVVVIGNSDISDCSDSGPRGVGMAALWSAPVVQLVEAGLGQVMQNHISVNDRDAALHMVSLMFNSMGTTWLSPRADSIVSSATKGKGKGMKKKSVKSKKGSKEDSVEKSTLVGLDLVQVCVRFAGIELRILVDSFCQSVLPDGVGGSGGGDNGSGSDNGSGNDAEPGSRPSNTEDTPDASGGSGGAGGNSSDGGARKKKELVRVGRMLPVCYSIVEHATHLLLDESPDALAVEPELILRLHGALVDFMSVVLHFTMALAEMPAVALGGAGMEGSNSTGTGEEGGETKAGGDTHGVVADGGTPVPNHDDMIRGVFLATTRLVGAWFVEETMKLKTEFVATLPFLLSIGPLSAPLPVGTGGGDGWGGGAGAGGATSAAATVAAAAASVVAGATGATAEAAGGGGGSAGHLVIDPFDFLIPAVLVWMDQHNAVHRVAIRAGTHWRALRSIQELAADDMSAACQSFVTDASADEEAGGGALGGVSVGTFTKLRWLSELTRALMTAPPSGGDNDDDDGDGDGDVDDADSPALDGRFVAALPALAYTSRHLGAFVASTDAPEAIVGLAKDAWTETLGLACFGRAEWMEVHGDDSALWDAVAAAQDEEGDRSAGDKVAAELVAGAAKCFLLGCKGTGVPREGWSGFVREMTRCLSCAPGLRSRLMEQDVLGAAAALNSRLPTFWALAGEGNGAGGRVGGEDEEEKEEEEDLEWRAQAAAQACRGLLTQLQLMS